MISDPVIFYEPACPSVPPRGIILPILLAWSWLLHELHSASEGQGVHLRQLGAHTLRDLALLPQQTGSSEQGAAGAAGNN